MSTDLRAAISSYLAARRARGYRLEGHEQLLGAFLDSMEARGETRITVPGPGTPRGSRPCGRSPATCTPWTRPPLTRSLAGSSPAGSPVGRCPSQHRAEGHGPRASIHHTQPLHPHPGRLRLARKGSL
jgi:hypothetical protein